jgi:hypothetical protein
MKPSPLRSSVIASLSIAGFLAVGCKKDEAPPPLPSAAPVAANTAPLELKPEDAGVKPPEAGPAPKKGGGSRSGGLSACCAALAQNATMAPPTTNGYMLQAAALCQSMAAQGKDKAAVGGLLLGALQGAGLPSACK